MSLSFKVTAEDRVLIEQIVERAISERYLGARVRPADRTELWMDITAVHANGCPLDLAGLLAAPAFDFTHDLAGIQTHIDRTYDPAYDRHSEILRDCFLPRLSARAS